MPDAWPADDPTVAAIAEGTIRASAAVEACLERVAAREATIGAWVALDADGARESARAMDRDGSGPLRGVPVAVKDVIDTADLPTAYGSPIYAGHRPVIDAASVALLRAAGAIVLGKTVTTEFAGWHAGRTTNPHDPRHTPGGSSSGSAAAVADGMVPLALGTQTGGSVIRPAAFCGVVGFKPSFGLVPRAGVKVLADSLDTLGVMARTVADAARAAQVMGGRRVAALERPTAPRIGLHWTCHGDRATPAAQAALRSAAASLGARHDAAAPPAFDRLYDLQPVIETAELARSLAPEWYGRREQLSPVLRENIRDGLATDPAAYLAALAHGDACRAAIGDLFGLCDALLTFSALGEAPPGLDDTGDNVFNRIWTLLGLPCVTLPAGRGRGGLPIGVQLVGRPRDDDRLLGIAAWAAARLDPMNDLARV